MTNDGMTKEARRVNDEASSPRFSGSVWHYFVISHSSFMIGDSSRYAATRAK